MNPQSILYHVKTRAGTFWIMPQPGSPGRYWLGVDDDALGSYASPMQAADDVYMHATGHHDWDKLDTKVNAPTDLSEWHKGPPDSF